MDDALKMAKLEQRLDDHINECTRIREANLSLVNDIKNAVSALDKRLYMYLKEDHARWMKILVALLILALSSTGALLMLIIKA